MTCEESAGTGASQGRIVNGTGEERGRIGAIDHAQADDVGRERAARVVEDVRTGKITYNEKYKDDGKPQFKHRQNPRDSYKQGIITDIAQVGGYPVYKSVKPLKDTDNDGMPDEWEVKYGLNPKDASDAVKDCNGDGYTNIEKYINGIDPSTKVDWSDWKNNYDTLAKKGGLN